MFFKRTIVSLVLLPVGILVIMLGGPVYAAVISGVLALAAWEFGRLFIIGRLNPSSFLLVAGAVALAVGRTINGFESAPWLISLIVLGTMTFHMVSYERGEDQAGTDFAVTLAGILYIGFIGAYLISLRDLPEGEWWLMVVLPAVWLADAGAYLIGSRWGKRKMSPRLSPKKSWEGYFAGILFGVIGTLLLTCLWGLWLQPDSAITLPRAVVIGLVMSVFPTLGDLGESMFKRQVGVKDSGNLLPGHGGVLDRIDSWLWAAVLGYYLVVWMTTALPG
jgi:phosphatidate cytidylyltransferase